MYCLFFFFFSSRRRHTRCSRDWSSDVCSSDLGAAGAVVLTAGGNNSSTTFSGVMQNGSGTVALAKTGTGTLTWSGVNTYSGTTTVSAGVLDVQNNSSLGTTAGATTVASRAALQLDGGRLVVAGPST